MGGESKKKFLREDLLFSLCGLNCGLCPMQAGGYCPGCGGGAGNQPCRFARCAQSRGVAYCFACQAYPCEKYAGFDEYDSFLSHQRRERNIRAAQEAGLEAYQALQREKRELLGYLLDHCNDGRRKSFYCLALELLEWEAVCSAIDRAALSQLPDSRSRAAQAAEALRRAAERSGVELKLRRKKKPKEA